MTAKSQCYLPLYNMESSNMSLLMQQMLVWSVLGSSATLQKACLKPTAHNTQENGHMTHNEAPLLSDTDVAVHAQQNLNSR